MSETDPDEPPPPPPVEVSGELVEAQPYPSPPTTPAPAEEILPAAADLQDAVGAPTKRRPPEPEPEGDEVETRWSRRTMAIAGGSLVAGIGIVALVFLGRANTDRYLLTCSTDRMTPEQGRGFPPWGSRPLTGPQWKPIALPANAECTPKETDDPAALEKMYLDVLVDHASTALTAKNLLDPTSKTAPAPLDTVAEQLDQALLLARAPEHRDQRKEIERLQGDVQYWRATIRLRDANAALLDAARQFDAAAAARPRHVSDAGEWAGFLRKLTEQLQAGPGGAPGPVAVPPPPQTTTTAPPGTALPVEPEGSASPPAPVDAGLPTGGVLL